MLSLSPFYCCFCVYHGRFHGQFLKREVLEEAGSPLRGVLVGQVHLCAGITPPREEKERGERREKRRERMIRRWMERLT